MSGPEITWSRDIPPEIVKMVKPLVTKHLHLIPGWCNTLAIRFGEADEARIVAHVRADFQYRQARMTICPNIVNESAADRERTIVHEFYHIPFAPIYDWTRKLIEAFFDDEMQKKLMSELADLEEGLVQDLTFMRVPKRV